MDRADPDCLAPPVEHWAYIEVEHWGSPMACAVAIRKDGTEYPPTRRYCGCYWAEEARRRLDYIPAKGNRPRRAACAPTCYSWEWETESRQRHAGLFPRQLQ